MSALQLWLQNHKRNLSQDAIDEALMEYIEHVEKQRDEFMESERKLSDAYIKLREKLSAFDTPTAPTAEQVYAHTEAKLDRLIQQRDELLADVAEEAAVREKLATLLAETAVELKGPEAALFRHSWHDLAEVAAGVVKQRDELLSAQKADAAFVCLEDLVNALDATNWSSWQTTAKFDSELSAARDFIAIMKVGAA